MEEFVLYIIVMAVAGIISLVQKAAQKNKQSSGNKQNGPRKESRWDEFLKSLEQQSNSSTQQPTVTEKADDQANDLTALPVRCEACGFSNPSESTFCMNCGKVTDASAEKTVQDEEKLYTDEESNWNKPEVLEEATTGDNNSELNRIFLNPESLRNGIILKEILDLPLALRE